MAKKISEEKIVEINKLYIQGLTPIEITMKTGVSYSSVYGLTIAKQRINPETGEKFKSPTEYQNYLSKQREQNPKNKKLGSLIIKRLNELGKTQRYLADKLGISNAIISDYTSGKSLPNKYNVRKLFSILEVPYKTLDDMIEA